MHLKSDLITELSFTRVAPEFSKILMATTIPVRETVKNKLEKEQERENQRSMLNTRIYYFFEISLAQAEDIRVKKFDFFNRRLLTFQLKSTVRPLGESPLTL